MGLPWVFVLAGVVACGDKAGEDEDDEVSDLIDADGDGYAAPADCDDADPLRYPGAQEICDPDGRDEDCDGLVNDLDDDVLASTQSTFYADADGDGYAALGADTVSACEQPVGAASEMGDCDDTDPDVRPDGQEVCDDADRDEDCDGLKDDADDSVDPASLLDWYADADRDGWGTGPVLQTACDGTTIQASRDGDCDDADADVHPDATEVCDLGNVDEDCDGLRDDADDSVDPGTFSTFYLDFDGDGHGSTTTVEQCDPSSIAVTSFDDCDDNDASVSPSASEVCDAADVDEDCDGLADDADASVDLSGGTTWYVDSDGDGYPGSTTAVRCDAQAGDGTSATDCDDTDASISPGAQEVCDSDNVDEDCDGLSDHRDPSVDTSTYVNLYTDGDSDGYGDGAAGSGCVRTGYAEVDGDCDDTDASVNPGADEICATTADDDCDGDSNEVGVSDCEDWYADGDADGYGTGTAVCQCVADATYTTTAGDDCDDADATVNPGESEVTTDGVDNDCDGRIDELGPEYPLTGDYRIDWVPGTSRYSTGLSASDELGDVVDGGVDFDGDGWADVLATAPDRTAGGSDSGSVLLLPGPVTGWTSLSAELTGAAGQGVKGVAIVGDEDGDGMADLVVGARDDTSGTKDGIVYLISGTDVSGGGDLGTVASGAWTSDTWDHIGREVIAAGDLFGGGDEADLLVATGGSYASTRWTLIDGPVSAATGVMTDLSTTYLSGSSMPKSVAAGEDIDGDGIDDLLLGGGGRSTSASRTWFVLGSTSLSGTIDPVADADGLVYTRYTPDGDLTQYAGWSVDFAGDVDGDGYEDVLVGTPSQSSTLAAGAAIYYGPLTSGAYRSTMETWIGRYGNRYEGSQVAPAGDIDEDGYDDVWISSSYNTSSSAVAVLHLGSPSTSGSYDVRNDAHVTVASYDGFGDMKTRDLDGDGFLDLILGRPEGSPGGTGSTYGDVRVLHANTAFRTDS